MYRIRRESGEEVTLSSIDEFGAAVAAGIVTARAEIFHARAEKWLPIASHPHFKMAQDRITGAAASKPPVRSPGLTGSGQRPVVGAPGQRATPGASAQRPAVTAPQASAPTTPALSSGTPPRAEAPQLRVLRQEPASGSTAASPIDVTQKPAPRWNSAQRPAARAVAPKPPVPPATPASELRLVRADALLSGAATAPALPEMDFEILPTLEAPAASGPASTEPVKAEAIVSQAAVAEPAPVAKAPVVAPAPESLGALERAPAAVELVSHEEQPAAGRGEVEIINPDRSMPVVSDRLMPLLEIPDPIRDFGPAEEASVPAVRSSSKRMLFVGLGLAAVAAAAIGFFILRPTGSAPASPGSTVRSPAQQQASTAPATSLTSAPAPSAPVTAPTGASTGLGGDVQTRKPRKSDDAQTATKPIGDGLEPPPVLPAAPKLGKLGDAAAIPTVESGTPSLKMLDRASALERQRRLIDSSMRQ